MGNSRWVISGAIIALIEKKNVLFSRKSRKNSILIGFWAIEGLNVRFITRNDIQSCSTIVCASFSDGQLCANLTDSDAMNYWKTKKHRKKSFLTTLQGISSNYLQTKCFWKTKLWRPRVTPYRTWRTRLALNGQLPLSYCRFTFSYTPVSKKNQLFLCKHIGNSRN